MLLKKIISPIRENEYVPQILHDNKSRFYVLDLESYSGEKKRFNSVSEMLDTYYSGKAERDRVKQKAGDLIRFF